MVERYSRAVSIRSSAVTEIVSASEKKLLALA